MASKVSRIRTCRYAWPELAVGLRPSVVGRLLLLAGIYTPFHVRSTPDISCEVMDLEKEHIALS
jgi:hypothetical protein